MNKIIISTRMENKKDFLYVYFIENHINTEKSNILLSKNNKGDGELESIEEKIHPSYKNFKYIIYRFKAYISKIYKKLKDKKKKLFRN